MAIMSREKRTLHRAPEPESTAKWPKSPDGYSLKCPIGHGAFAVVHKATCYKEDGPVDVAVKVIDLEGCADSTFDEIRREMTTMRRCRHVNVLQFHVAFQNDSKIWLVMPISKAGSAADVMRCQPQKRFQDERIIAYILREVAKALDYFHSEKQMHRDLKGGNILLSPNGDVHLADFGVATPFSFHSRHNTFVGTPCWMAPEVLSHRQYDEKADVWSFGITALELLRGEAPYQRLHPLKVMKNIIENQPPHLSSFECSDGFSLVVDACLRRNPNERSRMSAFGKSKFFAKAENGPLRELLRNTPAIENRQHTFEPYAMNCPQYDSDCDQPMFGMCAKEQRSETATDWLFEEDEFDGFPEEET
eukprot:GEMP01008612.1.p1 GENE.GEMP01008612.1~~GEMP01008612.1.p1  ORF type:complete len:362 (+),score=48.36 GEMP01008612.1:711-1796(+)